jgi:4-pyridoxolactonase
MMVELANRRPMLFTADACYSKKSMDMMCISSFHLDPVGSLNSMKRLKALAEQHDAELFYSHDLESFKGYQTGAQFYS